MNIHDGVGLFQKIVDNGLADKCLRDFSFSDLKLLADLLADHCDGTVIPTYDRERKRLVIPFNAPLKYRFWLHKLSDTEKYQLLRELGVPAGDVHLYMHQGAIEAAKDESNNEKDVRDRKIP